MDEITSLQDTIKNKLHELRNSRKEINCLNEFVREKKLIEEYSEYRVKYFKRIHSKW